MKISDLSDVSSEETPVTLVPPGTYEVLVTDAEEGRSSTGKPCIELSLEIMSSGDFRGRTLKDWVYITEAALWRVRMLLDGLQVEVPEGEFDLEPSKLINRRCEISVEHEVYDNKVKVRVRRYEPVDGEAEVAPPPEPVSDIPF